MRPALTAGRVARLEQPEITLSEEQRVRIGETLEPYLLDPSRLNEGIDRTEDSLQSYQDWKTVQKQLRPGSRRALEKEFLNLSKAASEYLKAAEALSDEAACRLGSVYEFSPDFDEDLFGSGVPTVPTFGHLVDPDRYRDSLRTASRVSGRARLLARTVISEERPTGAPRKGAAYTACDRMADIWKELTGRMLHPDGGSNRSEGKFLRYFEAAMRCVEPKFAGAHIARQIAERRASAGENSD